MQMRFSIRPIVQLLCCSIVIAARSVQAQAIIAGTVRDGLTNRPLAAATVQLVLASDPAGKMRTSVTDSSGAFQITAIPPGRYLLDFTHHRVDELGIELPPRVVDVPVGATTLRYELAIPGPRALARVLCNGERADSAGVLGGRVLDAETGLPAGSGTVTASWVELRVTAAEVHRTPRTVRAPLDDAGRFAVCGIPSEIPVRVEAAVGAKRTGEIEMQVSPFSLLHRDLFVAANASADSVLRGAMRARGLARVTGHVRRTNGAPVDRAQVLVIGTGASTLTDAAGAFAIDSLPAGSRELEVRALGFVPANTVVDLRTHMTATADLTLTNRVAQLEAVTVFGTAPKRDEAGGFAERSRGIFGRFFTAEQIRRIAPASVPDLMRMVPGLRVTTAQGSLMNTVTSRGDGLESACLPDVFIDGFLVADGATSLDTLVRPSEIGAIEVYVDQNTVPVQFRRGPCGSIVIWTRLMVP